jgi:RNA methyltransferase, TrmH family
LPGKNIIILSIDGFVMENTMKEDPNSSLIITSLQNPRVKKVTGLREREHRDPTGLMLIDGLLELERALANNHVPMEIYWCPEVCKNDARRIIGRCREQGVQLFECNQKVLEKMTYGNLAGGWVAVAPQVKYSFNQLKITRPALVVVAEKVEKPGNIGSILRCADAAGAQAVIVCDGKTDINNPNVVRNSRGAVFTVPVVEATSQETLAWLKKEKIQIVATTPRTDRLYTDLDLTKNIAIVVGEEHEGLSATWLQATDQIVKIPMLGQVDSLNVAAVVSILLYEAVRQRGALTPALASQPGAHAGVRPR